MKKPIYKKWWFWLIVVLAVLMGIGGMGEEEAPDRSVEVSEAFVEPTDTPAPTPEPTDTPEPTATPEPTPEPEHSYVINVNTGVFHVEGCQYERRMSEGNKQYVTATRSYMLAQGYDPCDKCHP